jgi:hypothetical protein
MFLTVEVLTISAFALPRKATRHKMDDIAKLKLFVMFGKLYLKLIY